MWNWFKRSAPANTAQDQRLARAVAALMQQLEIKSYGPILNYHSDSTPNSPLWSALNEFGAIRKEDPTNPVLHYAHAAAMCAGMQWKTAEDMLLELTRAHPEFWLADVTLRNFGAAQQRTPFLLPEFNRGDAVAHDWFNYQLKTAVILSTRRGVLPRSVIFMRQSLYDGDPAKFRSSRMEFATVVSEINNPQVVAIYFKIHDDPVRPFVYEMPAAPFHGQSGRFAYEVFARQGSFDFVVLDNAGRVIHQREISPSQRMIEAHRTLAKMFKEQPPQDELDPSVLQAAIRRHQATLDLGKVKY